jgi:hypothetical protein
MYTGLLNFSILFAFGITGLLATVEQSGINVRRGGSAVDTRGFKVPPNLTDYQAALAALNFLNLPLVSPPADNAVHRDRQDNVTFSVYSANGAQQVTLIEAENRIRIETRRNDIWHFLENLHATTLNTLTSDLRIRMWAWYTEFAIWSLIAMVLSGVWLWLSSRPTYFWAGISLVAGNGAFLVLYFLAR